MRIEKETTSFEARFLEGECGYGLRPAGERLSRVGFGLAALFVGAQTFNHVLELWVFDGDLHVLELNTVENPFNWLSALMILAAGIGLFQLSRARPASSLLRITALLVAYLAIDDAIELHYRVPYWQVVYAPLLGLVAWTFWSLSSASPGPGRGLLRAGLASLLAAFVVDVVASPIMESGDWEAGEWPHELKVVLKEDAQLGGWMLIAFGVIAVYVGVVRDRTPVDDDHSAAPAAPTDGATEI
jgi:hypothetical protein